MSLQLFNAELGFGIVDQNGDDLVTILTSAGAPGGDTAEQDAAPVGSLAMDRTNGELYQKHTSGTGTDKWDTIKSSLELSWRDPVRTVDTATWANIAAVEAELNDIATPGNIGGVDSDQYSDGDRILLTDLTTGNENVYIVTGTPGSAATLVEDANTATDGDILWVEEGTNADSQYAYNGTNWVQVGGTAAAELGYIRAFIGKNAAGSETPDYGAGVEYVGQTDDLETAVAKLDAGLDDARHEEVNAGVTTAITQDSVLVDEVDVVRWLIHAKDDSGNVRAAEIYATHDGTTGADANDADYTVYGKLRIGTIAGLQASVDVNGVGAAQVMRLRVQSTTSVTVKSIRMVA